MLDLSLTLANESWISIYRSRYANLEDLIPAGLLPTDPDYPITDPAEVAEVNHPFTCYC